MARPSPDRVQRVAVIGAGTIGASWAAQFLARGLEVAVFDPAADTADRVRRFVDAKDALAGHLRRRAAFLFYSESGLGEEAAATLHAAGIEVLDPEKLAGFEALPEADR